MAFSEFLNSRRQAAKALVCALKKHYSYVSVLGVDIKARSIRVDRNTSNISAGRDTECGFVVKLCSGGVFYEYSLDDIGCDTAALAEKIAASFRLGEALRSNAITGISLSDEPLVQSFAREVDLTNYSDDQLLSFCRSQCDSLLAKSE